MVPWIERRSGCGERRSATQQRVMRLQHGGESQRSSCRVGGKHSAAVCKGREQNLVSHNVSTRQRARRTQSEGDKACACIRQST